MNDRGIAMAEAARTTAKTEEKLQARPAQHQETKPGRESRMAPKPLFDDPDYQPAGKLQGKVALITGGDSGIGRAVAVIYAKEGADVAIVYLNEHEDAQETARAVEAYGKGCLLISGDIGEEAFCHEAVQRTIQTFGRLDILVNNAGEHWENEDIATLDMRRMKQTFRINIFSMFYLTQAALPHLPEGGAIINTASVTAYRGSAHLLDYSTTKGAIVTFTRSLSNQLLSRGIRVNGVAPGPIWTPLIPSSFSEQDVQEFGVDTPMGRAGQPSEVAPCYVFLAAKDSSYISGQILHPNGGNPVNT
jgi:NAD(P)-dependent dehydrogenase (short-subunit alcohol dehydrogenase family)